MLLFQSKHQYINQLISCSTSSAGSLTTAEIGSFVPVSSILSGVCVRFHAVVGTLVAECHCGDFRLCGFTLFCLNLIFFTLFLEVLLLHFRDLVKIKLLLLKAPPPHTCLLQRKWNVFHFFLQENIHALILISQIFNNWC